MDPTLEHLKELALQSMRNKQQQQTVAEAKVRYRILICSLACQAYVLDVLGRNTNRRSG